MIRTRGGILVVEIVPLPFFLKPVVEHLAITVFSCRFKSGIMSVKNQKKTHQKACSGNIVCK